MTPGTRSVRESTTSPGARLFAALTRAGVRHVYWKTRAGLQRALAHPEKDLDLLVAEEDLGEARRVLEQQGYRAMRGPLGAVELRGVTHYLAYDEASEALDHVHLHTRLYAGRPQLMGWRLPFERTLLASAVAHDGGSVLEPALDWALLSVRVALEPSIRENKAPERTLDGLAALTTDASRALAAVELLGESARRLAEDPLVSLRPATAAQWQMLVERALSPSRRLTEAGEKLRWTGVRAKSLGTGAWRRVRSPRPIDVSTRGRLRAGDRGLLVAIVGPDGSGKSTQVDALIAWLGRCVDVRRAYFGRGDAVSEAVRVAATIKWFVLERLGRQRPRTAEVVKEPGTFQRERARRPKGALVQLSRDLGRLSLAGRKGREIARAEQLVSEGLVVVADRFPHPTEFELDGPSIRCGEADPEWRRWLARRERSRFDAMRGRPDLLVRLHIAPELAHARKRDHRLDRIQKKSEALERASFGAARVLDVDATRPAHQIAAEVRRAVWEAL